MMTQQLPASILTAPLAQIDRRVLSQAWYSALRLAHCSQRSTAGGAERVRGAPLALVKSDAGGRPTCRSMPHDARPSRSNAAHARELKRAGEREPHSRLARKIERTFFVRRSRVERSTFTLDRDGARVHIVVQSTGNRVRLIAVCRPADRNVVARALSEARYALAARGWTLETGEREEEPCF